MKKCIPLRDKVLVIEYFARPIANQDTVDRAEPEHMFMCTPKRISAMLYTETRAHQLSLQDLEKIQEGISEVLDKDFALPAEDLRSY